MMPLSDITQGQSIHLRIDHRLINIISRAEVHHTTLNFIFRSLSAQYYFFVRHSYVVLYFARHGNIEQTRISRMIQFALSE